MFESPVSTAGRQNSDRNLRERAILLAESSSTSEMFAFMQHCPQALKLHIDNPGNLLARQSMKDHDIVDAIQKLRLEMFV